MSEGGFNSEAPRYRPEIAPPSTERFKQGITNIAQEYKRDFLDVQRTAKAQGLEQIRANPNTAQRFYEAEGRISAYETVLHNLGQSDLVHKLQSEIKQELAK